jgi:hypothetical protein
MLSVIRTRVSDGVSRRGALPKVGDVARGRTQRAATVGVAEHGSSAVLVTLAPGGELLDRRRIELIDRGLPTHPHHHLSTPKLVVHKSAI